MSFGEARLHPVGAREDFSDGFLVRTLRLCDTGAIDPVVYMVVLRAHWPRRFRRGAPAVHSLPRRRRFLERHI